MKPVFGVTGLIEGRLNADAVWRVGAIGFQKLIESRAVSVDLIIRLHFRGDQYRALAIGQRHTVEGCCLGFGDVAEVGNPDGAAVGKASYDDLADRLEISELAGEFYGECSARSSELAGGCARICAGQRRGDLIDRDAQHRQASLIERHADFFAGQAVELHTPGLRHAACRVGE